MSATISPVAVREQERRGSRISTYSLFAGTWQIGMYFWIAVVIISALVSVVIHTWDELDGSVADGVLGSAPIFLGVMGIIMPLGTLPLHLAGGGTRRSLFRGTVAAAVGIGVSFGLAGALGMLVEHLVFNALDWSSAVVDAGLYDSSGDFFAIWLSWSLSSIAYFLGGAAIALGYYRWGGVLGTVQLFVVLALVIGGEIALGGGLYSAGVEHLTGGAVAAPLAVLISLVTSALVALVLQRTLRDVPLKPNSASAC
ncbi:hypothetical protein [Mumia sp. DW29H23]|uniref:hypothetical protein n=1 Tax=Mumia sp. DW29H23 TaxID=3421241 RepID=UPI003D68BCE0